MPKMAKPTSRKVRCVCGRVVGFNGLHRHQGACKSHTSTPIGRNKLDPKSEIKRSLDSHKRLGRIDSRKLLADIRRHRRDKLEAMKRQEFFDADACLQAEMAAMMLLSEHRKFLSATAS